MSEANKSLMLSEAEIIEAINSDSLISVSLGAGQPQKNVKLSTLASVVAGLLPSAGFSCQVYDQYIAASSPAIIEVSSNKVTLLNANYTYKNESRTMLFATGQMNVLLDDKTYGLNFSYSDNKLTISTSSNGNYGVRIRVITF